jgi:hypothetical protein
MPYLSIVRILTVFLSFDLLHVEDDEAAGSVAQGQVLARLVELHRRDDVLFGHFVGGGLVAEHLGEFVVGTAVFRVHPSIIKI